MLVLVLQDSYPASLLFLLYVFSTNAWLDSEINIPIRRYLLIVFGEPNKGFSKILKTQKVLRMNIANYTIRKLIRNCLKFIK